MFYKITGGAFSSKSSDKDTSFSIHREFRNNDILIAREECFKAFHSYIEVFLQGIDKDYTSHNQSIIDLKNFFLSNKKKKLDIINDDEFIQINFVYDETVEFISKNKKATIYKGDITIHGMEVLNKSKEFERIYLKNLMFEKAFLKKNSAEFNNTYFDEAPNENCKTYDIINTPINFDEKK